MSQPATLDLFAEEADPGPPQDWSEGIPPEYISQMGEWMREEARELGRRRMVHDRASYDDLTVEDRYIARIDSLEACRARHRHKWRVSP